MGEKTKRTVSLRLPVYVEAKRLAKTERLTISGLIERALLAELAHAQSRPASPIRGQVTKVRLPRGERVE